MGIYSQPPFLLDVTGILGTWMIWDLVSLSDVLDCAGLSVNSIVSSKEDLFWTKIVGLLLVSIE